MALWNPPVRMPGHFEVNPCGQEPPDCGCDCKETDEEPCDEEEDENEILELITDCDPICRFRRRYTVTLPNFDEDFDLTGTGNCLQSLCPLISGADIVLEYREDYEAYLQEIFPVPTVADSFCGAWHTRLSGHSLASTHWWATGLCLCGLDDLGPFGFSFGFLAELSIQNVCNGNLEFIIRAGTMQGRTDNPNWQNPQSIVSSQWGNVLPATVETIPGLCDADDFSLSFSVKTNFNFPACSLPADPLDIDFRV